LDRVNLRQIGLIRSFVGLPMTGVLTGRVAMDLPTEIDKSAGEIKLEISQLSIGDGRAKLKLPGFRDGLTVQRIAAGTLAVDAKLEGGVLKFVEFSSDGDDLELSCDGDITLREPLGASRLALLLKVKLSDAYLERSNLAALMEFEPSLSRAKTPDGALQYQLRGTFNGRIVPTPAGNARPGSAGR
jgi:type II secretion system protein N